MAWVSVETGAASRWFIANNTTHNNDTKRNIFVEHQTKFNITMYINRKLLLDGTRVVIKTNLSPMYVAHGGWMFMSFKIRNEQKGKRRWKKKREGKCNGYWSVAEKWMSPAPSTRRMITYIRLQCAGTRKFMGGAFSCMHAFTTSHVTRKRQPQRPER